MTKLKDNETVVQEAPEMLKEKRTDIFSVDPRTIKIIPGFNARVDMGDIEELAASILEQGMRKPVIGFKKDGDYYLTDGHRRHEAVMLLLSRGHLMYMDFITKKHASEEQRTIDMIVCNDGKALNAVETASIIERLSKFGLSNADIAKKIGKTDAYISNMLVLAGVPQKLKNSIAKKDIAATTVVNLLRGDKALTAEDIIEQVDNLKVSQPEKKATTAMLNGENKEFNSLGMLKKLVGKLEEEDVENPSMLKLFKKLFAGELSEEYLVGMLDVKEACIEPDDAFKN